MWRIVVQWGVRFGIRAQLVMALGALLVLAFLPLFFAVASLARASLQQSWERHARALGRAIAGHVGEARRARDPGRLERLLDAQIGDGVGAIGVYDAAGELQLRRGERGAAEALPARVVAGQEQVLTVDTPRGAALVVLVPTQVGSVGALIHIDRGAIRVAPLVRLVALAMGVLALALLVFLYLVLTRLVVAPIDRLSRAARRVAEGGRALTVPVGSSRELYELGSSLGTMTDALRAEEGKLRDKVSELERATDELRRAQSTLVRSERLASVGRLAAGLAHEIGNPIAAILSMQELLLDGNLDDQSRDFVERMKRETERVHRVLRDLLDFARPAAQRAGPRGGGSVDDEIASVSDSIEHVAALVRPQQSFKQVELHTSVQEGLPAVAISASRLEQVLLNLLLNAADAVAEGAGRVTLHASLAGQGVQVCIEDDGGGIDPSVRDRLFEPFVTTKEVGKGTGLGLAVCRGLLESAGGGIELQEGAEGARFVIDLPPADGAG